MTRFFVDPNQIDDDIAHLNEADSHHLRVVLQSSPGDAIQILDGTGALWDAVIVSLGKKTATARLGAQSWPDSEPSTHITIAQALPKMNEKMEQVLQRGTEIGAAAFRAFSSTHSMTHLTGERQEKRMSRWNAIVKTAAEQSRRVRLPRVHADEALQDVLASVPRYDLALFAYEHERQTTLKASLSSAAVRPRTILVLVGPETGFTTAEATAARSAGAVSITLGRRILRTETAAMVAAAQILYELEG